MSTDLALAAQRGRESGQSALITLLQRELAPFPGRWRDAFFCALGTALAFTIGSALQIGSFITPAMAFMALQPTVVCTWRLMFWRLFLACAAALVLFPLGGFVVQLPWLLLPFLFISISGVAYFVSLMRQPLEALAILYSIVMVLVTGVFSPNDIGNVVLQVVAAYAIGVATATAFSEFFAPTRPRDRLAAALAECFRAAQQHLVAAADVYFGRAPLSERPADFAGDLAQQLQLLDLVRQERAGADLERAFLALMTAAERIHLSTAAIETLASEPVGHRYRDALVGQVAVLLGELDACLASFTHASEHPEALARAPWPVGMWPDLPAALAAIEQRQNDLLTAGSLGDIDVAESGNTNALVQTLRNLADVLHVAPSALVHMAIVQEEAVALRPPSRFLPRLDPYTARWSAQVGLALVIAYILVIVSHVPDFFTALWNPLLIAQSSYGATIRRAGLRVAGVLIGGLIGIGVIAAIMPNISEVSAAAAVLFAVVLPCQYVGLGGPAISYAGVQTAFTYILVTSDLGPTTDVHVALWRAFGNLVGTACLFGVFRLVAPDYAGRQLIARLRDLLRTTLDVFPAPGAALRTPAELIVIRRELSAATGDLLRLVDEARLEGAASGVDSDAAVEAIGLATRIANRAGLATRARRTAPPPPLDEEAAAALARLQDAIRTRLAHDIAVLEARHTRARPGSHAFRTACAAAAAVSVQARPDLHAALQVYAERLNRARFAELMAAPTAGVATLLAELEHLRRIVALADTLDQRIVRTCLPPERGSEGSRVRGFELA